MGVRWTTEKPSEFTKRKKKELHDYAIPAIAYRIADSLEDEIKKRTPVGVEWTPPRAMQAVASPTGHLKRSIQKDRKGKWRTNHHIWTVSTNVEYAPYVEYGTAPHVITPRSPGGVLAYFTSSGNKRFSKMVKHPGTKPVYMFARSVGTIRPRMGLMSEPTMRIWASDNKAAITGLKARSR
jgi:hypothetical protein